MSGIWFGWSVAVFLLTWFCMLLSGMMILEANLNYPVGSSFTITRDLLGQGWNVVNGLSIAFVLYILTYAYISGGGSIDHPVQRPRRDPAGKARWAAVRPGGGAGGGGVPARWTASPR